jgi:hypothetical protein
MLNVPVNPLQLPVMRFVLLVEKAVAAEDMKVSLPAPATVEAILSVRFVLA